MDTNLNSIPRLFGTSGIRGKIGTTITADLALMLGRAISTLLGAGSNVVVGYDSRISNQMLEKALTAGILEGGCHVLSLGMAPTPLVGFATMKLADAGVMITASHNPPQDNGLKVWNSNGMAFRSHQERELERIIHDKTFSTVSWENIGKIKDIKTYHHNI